MALIKIQAKYLSELAITLVNYFKQINVICEMPKVYMAGDKNQPLGDC